MSKSFKDQRGQARTKRPERTQVEMQLFSLDQLVDANHQVRLVWQYVQSLDLTELYAPIKATVDNVGRDPIDPQILFALWLFATLEGTTSGRRIAELTTRDIPYMWICGGVSVNYHRVCDFRTQHGELLQRVLTDSIAVLLHNDLITLETIAQDGMRVRASAGSGSFRTEKGLEKARQTAQEYMDQLNQNEADPNANERRNVSAQKRAAREKLERIEQAQLEMQDMQEKYKKRSSSEKRSEPRASTTDPESRRMKMGDNGTRPAMNVQFASDGDAQLIVSVEVTSQGSSAIAEFPNADCRNRNLTQFQVRGLVKAKAQTLWHVLAFNLLRMRTLRCPLRDQSFLEVLMAN